METNIMFKEFNEINDRFPKKSEAKGTLTRKRRAREIAKRNMRRMEPQIYGSGYYPVGADGRYDDESPVYMKRMWRTQESKHIKQNCNRKLRRSNKLKNIVANRGEYKKLTEFWWELY